MERATVCIIQALAKHYRVALFDRLHRALADAGVRLRVVYSAPNARHAERRDDVDLPPSYGRKVPAIWALHDRLVLQPAFRDIATADLVVVEQANKHLVNYPLLALSRLGFKRVAYWGHGRNRQSSARTPAERLKRQLVNATDWWFAYTRGTRDYLVGCGVPERKITVVQNSIDVGDFQRELAAVSAEEVDALRARLGIPRAAKIGLFCGSLHDDKRLPFLIDSALAMRERTPGLHLLIVGAGPEGERLRHAAAGRPWIHLLGARFGKDKAICFRAADVFLNPGLIGLGVLDAFAAGLPVLTTDVPIHSPEIEYVESGVNGWVTPHAVADYAAAGAALLADAARLRAMRAAAACSATRYSIDEMAGNFKGGILECLALH
jgi:glycosyltransferase involved in cell wall biosynthesis